MAMSLAEKLHYTAEFQTHPPQAAGTVYFAMDVDNVPAALGSRPDWPQRRTVQQIVDPVPLPTFNDPAPQTVQQLPDILRFFDTLVPDPKLGYRSAKDLD